MLTCLRSLQVGVLRGDVGTEYWEAIVVPSPVYQVVEAFLGGQGPATGKMEAFP